MDISFLKSLISVVEHGSIAAAARTENITATAISQRIKSLENELGCQLLSRVGHRALPTENWLKIEASARKIITQLQTLKLEALDGEILGDLRLGAISTALTDHVPDLAKHLQINAPKARLTVIPGTSSELFDRLLDDEIDGAMIVEPSFKLPKSLRLSVVESQRLCFISMHQVNSNNINEELMSSPIIVYDRFSWGGKLAWDWISANSTKNRILCEIDSLETIACMVEKGLGVAVVPLWGDLNIRYKVNISPLSHNNKYARDIVFVSNLASPVQGLLTLCKDQLK